MLDAILVPLDGSEMAECVLPHVSAIARSFNAEITLLRMLEKNQTNGSPQLFDLLNWQLSKTRATVYLEKIKVRIQESGLRVRVVVQEGLVAQGISDYAQNQGIKLIVLCSHGRSGLTNWGISSITQKIILSAPTSVLIVRANQNNNQTKELSSSQLYRRILVPLDGSQRAENVLPIITQLAHYHNSQLQIVHVVQTPEMARQMPPTPEDTDLAKRVVERNMEEAGNYLEKMKSLSYLNDISLQTRLISGEKTAAELHRLTEQEHIDMVALSAHGYSGNQQWPYGDLVNNFIMYGKTSLLIVQDLPARLESKPIEMISRERGER